MEFKRSFIFGNKKPDRQHLIVTYRVILPLLGFLTMRSYLFYNPLITVYQAGFSCQAHYPHLCKSIAYARIFIDWGGLFEIL